MYGEEKLTRMFFPVIVVTVFKTLTLPNWAFFPFCLFYGNFKLSFLPSPYIFFLVTSFSVTVNILSRNHESLTHCSSENLTTKSLEYRKPGGRDGLSWRNPFRAYSSLLFFSLQCAEFLGKFPAPLRRRIEQVFNCLDTANKRSSSG